LAVLSENGTVDGVVVDGVVPERELKDDAEVGLQPED
jgi:hypothetical protein